MRFAFVACGTRYFVVYGADFLPCGQKTDNIKMVTTALPKAEPKLA
jgi:hypothetical protein